MIADRSRICKQEFKRRRARKWLAIRIRGRRAGFPHDDPLYLKVAKVRDAMHELTVAVHYMACDNIGRGGLSAHHLPMKADAGERDDAT
jgi:hypothetical protein